MSLRDDTEAVLRAWDSHETGRGAAPVIDYDCCPPPAPAAPAASRLDVYRSLAPLREAASRNGDARLAREIAAHLAYLRELMGQRTTLDKYVRATQGCPAAGWPGEHISEREEMARACLEALGIGWGPDTENDLEHAEGVIGAAETRDGIYQTARTAAKAMTDPAIMAWVTPPRRGTLPMFNPDGFAAGTGTLFLLSKSRSAAAPLIAALSDTAMRAAERRAERLGGRLDPPMVVVLDEAANICRIADLPDLYSHLGSRGITPVTILQSYEQGVTVWGEQGMAALWGAATKKIIGAGVDSPRLARDLATLIGQHDVPVRSINYGEGRASESVSLRRQDILEPAAIRALPPGTALLLATGAKPALIHLTPWHAGPCAAQISAAQAAAQDEIRAAANQAWPAQPDHGRTSAISLQETSP